MPHFWRGTPTTTADSPGYHDVHTISSVLLPDTAETAGRMPPSGRLDSYPSLVNRYPLIPGAGEAPPRACLSPSVTVPKRTRPSFVTHRSARHSIIGGTGTPRNAADRETNCSAVAVRQSGKRPRQEDRLMQPRRRPHRRGRRNGTISAGFFGVAREKPTDRWCRQCRLRFVAPTAREMCGSSINGESMRTLAGRT